MFVLAWLERVVLERALGVLASILLFALMVVTCVDVVGRYFTNTPLIGAFETTEVGLALLIYAALPTLTLRDEHVRIDLLDRVVPRRWQQAHRTIVKMISVGVLALLTWALWRKANSIAASGTRTDSLHIPLGPIAYFMFAIAVVTAVALAILVVAELRGYRAAKASPQLGVE